MAILTAARGRVGACLAAALLLAGCSRAETLGDEAPVEVTLPASPTYRNGVEGLLDVKCASCHTSGSSRFAPDDTPRDLDLGAYTTVLRSDGVVMRGADSIGRWIFDGILERPVGDYRGGTIRRMPLEHATPLTDQERDGLLRWSNAGAPLDDTPVPGGGDAVRGETLYSQRAPGSGGQACVSCHDSNGGGIAGLAPAMRAVSVTPAKLQEMWLHRARHPAPLSDADALDLRAHILTLPDISPP